MKLRIKQVKEDAIGKVDLLSRDLYKLKMAKAISDAFHDKIHQLIRTGDLAKAEELLNRVKPGKDDFINVNEVSDNPEGDQLVLRFLQGIAKKFDYPVAQAARFVKERIKKLGYNEALDPVGKEDSDVDNDGDTDKSDKYLQAKRDAISKNIKEDNSKVNILGIAFNVTEMNGRIFFSFVDKKAASIKIREIGSNEIVNKIQKSLDNAYGKGEFFFKSGDHAEFQNGYLFQRNLNNVDLNKLKFESINEDHEIGMAINALDDIVMNAQQLKMKLGGEERNIPAWIQDHISQAQNFINQANTNFHEDNDFKNDATIAENDMSAEDEFNQLMKRYDWYAEMSDDSRKWDVQQKTNRQLYDLSKFIGADKALEIFNQYAPKGEPGQEYLSRTITSIDQLR